MASDSSVKNLCLTSSASEEDSCGGAVSGGDAGDCETFCDSAMNLFLEVFFDTDATSDEYYTAAVMFLVDLALAGKQLPRPAKRIGDAWFAFAIDQAAKEIAVNRREDNCLLENEEENIAADYIRRFGASILKEMVVSGWNHCSSCGGSYYTKPSFADEFGILEEDDSRYTGHLVHRVLQHLPSDFDDIEDEKEAEKVAEAYPRFVCYTCDIKAPRSASIFTYDNQFYIPMIKDDDAEETAIAHSVVPTRGFHHYHQQNDDCDGETAAAIGEEVSNDTGGDLVGLGYFC
jgi:hypothetical protein